jgi:protein TonB
MSIGSTDGSAVDCSKVKVGVDWARTAPDRRGGVMRLQGLGAAMGFAFVCFATCSGAAAAQDSGPEARWVINWADQSCTLSRRGVGEDAPGIGLTSAFSGEHPQILFLNPPANMSHLRQSAAVEIVLLPQGDRLPGYVDRSQRAMNERAVIVGVAADDLPDRFARSESIALERDGRKLVEVAYPAAAQAIEALRTCSDDLMSGWGIDLAARRALSRLPQGNPARFITNVDYPESALRAGEEGSVVVRVRVDPDGRVGECVPVSSSGSEAIDRRTCHIFQRRVRYEPALDADGNPVAAMIVSRLTWSIL